MQVWAACSFSVTHSHTPPFASPFLSPSPSLSFSSRSCLFSTVIAFYFVRLVPRLCPSFVWWLALSRSLLLCWCYRTHLIRHLDRYRCSNTPFIVYFGNSLLGFCQDLSVVVVVVVVVESTVEVAKATTSSTALKASVSKRWSKRSRKADQARPRVWMAYSTRCLSLAGTG